MTDGKISKGLLGELSSLLDQEAEDVFATSLFGGAISQLLTDRGYRVYSFAPYHSKETGRVACRKEENGEIWQALWPNSMKDKSEEEVKSFVSSMCDEWDKFPQGRDLRPSRYPVVDCASCARYEPQKRSSCSSCKGTGKMRDPGSYVCNQCGESLLLETGRGEQELGGLIDASVSGGYNSIHIFDSTTYEFSMCEKCLRTLFNGFKHPPDMFDYMQGGIVCDWSYEEDKEHYVQRMFEKSPEYLARAERRMCNANVNCNAAAIHHLFTSHEPTNRFFCEEHGAKHHHAMNQNFIHAYATKNLPFYFGKANREERVKLSNLALIFSYKNGKNPLTWHRFLPNSVAEAILPGITEDKIDEMGGIWLPFSRLHAPHARDLDLGPDGPNKTLSVFEFNAGDLIYGPAKDVREFAKTLKDHIQKDRLPWNFGFEDEGKEEEK